MSDVRWHGGNPVYAKLVQVGRLRAITLRHLRRLGAEFLPARHRVCALPGYSEIGVQQCLTKRSIIVNRVNKPDKTAWNFATSRRA